MYCSMITHVAGHMQESIYSDNLGAEAAWNHHSQALTEAAKVSVASAKRIQ